MPILNRNLIVFFSGLLIINSAIAVAGTDFEAQEIFAKARAKNHLQEAGHAAHKNHADKNQEFRGIFYGFLPCSDCTGVKATLSLKQHNNYLLVTQPAKESSREFYEKGKYTWRDNDQTVVLTPHKGDIKMRYYHIENEGKLVQLGDNGTPMDEQSKRYVLQRSDTVQSREVHMH